MEHHTYLTTYPLLQDYCQTNYGTPHISDYVSFATGLLTRLLSNNLWNTSHISLRILCDTTTVKQSWNTTHIWLRILCYRTTVYGTPHISDYVSFGHDYCQTYGTPHISDYVSFATGLLSNNLWNTTHIWLRILCDRTTVKQSMEHLTYLTTYPLLQDYCQTIYGTPHISHYVSFATGLLSNNLWNTTHIWLRILCYRTTVKQSMEHHTYLTTYPLLQDYCQTIYGTPHISDYVSFATGLLSNNLWNTTHIWLRILCYRTTVKQSMEHHTYLRTTTILWNTTHIWHDYCQTIYGTPHISDYVSFATGLLSNNLWNTTHIWLRILCYRTTVKQSMEHHTYLTTYPLLQDYCQTNYGTHISDYVSFATGLLSNKLWNTSHIWLRIYRTTYPLLQDYCQTIYGTPHISDYVSFATGLLSNNYYGTPHISHYVSFATGLLSNNLWNTTHISLRILCYRTTVLWNTTHIWLRILCYRTTVKQSMEHHTYLTTYPLLQDYCQTIYGTPHISDYVSFATGLLSNNLWNTTHIWLRILCYRTTVKQSMEHHTYHYVSFATGLLSNNLSHIWLRRHDYCQTIYGTPHISDYVSFATGLLLWNTTHRTYFVQDYCQTIYGTPHISDYVSFATGLLSNKLWNTTHIWLRILCYRTTVKQSMEHLTYLTTYPLLQDYCQTIYGTPHISDYVSFATGLLSNNLWNTSHIWLRILCYRTTVKQTMEHHTYLTTYPLLQDYCQTIYGTPHISDYVSFATGLLSNNLWNTTHIWLRILCYRTTVKQSMEHHTYLTTYPLTTVKQLWNTTHIWLRILCYRTTVKQSMEHHTYLTTYPLLQDYCQTIYGLRILCDRTTVKQSMEHHTYLTTYPLRHDYCQTIYGTPHISDYVSFDYCQTTMDLLRQDYCQTIYGTPHISDYVSFATGLLSNNLWNTSHISLTTVKQSMEHHTYLTTYPLRHDYCQTIYGTPHISDYVSFATRLLSNNLWNTSHIWLRILCYRTTVKQSMEHHTYLTTYPLQDYCQTIYGTPHISDYVSFATGLLSNNLWNTTHIWLRILCYRTTVKQSMEHHTYLTTYPLRHDYCQTIYGTPHISDYVSFATGLLSNNLWNTSHIIDYVSFATGLLSNNLWNTTHIWLRILCDRTTVKQSMEHHTYLTTYPLQIWRCSTVYNPLHRTTVKQSMEHLTYLTTYPLRQDYCQTIYGTPHISHYVSFATGLQDYCQTNYGTPHISDYVSFATRLLSNNLWNTSHISLRILCYRTTVKQSMEHHTYLTTYPLRQDYCQTIYGTPHISDYVSFATGLLSNKLWNTSHIWLRILCQTIYYVGLLSNKLWNTTHIWLRILCYRTTVKQSMEHHTYLTTYPLLQDYCQTIYGTPHISDYVSFATRLLSNNLWNTTHISLRILCYRTTVKQTMEHLTYLTTYPLLQDYCQTNYGTPHISDYVSFATGLLSNNLWNTTHISLRILCYRTTV